MHPISQPKNNYSSSRTNDSPPNHHHQTNPHSSQQLPQTTIPAKMSGTGPDSIPLSADPRSKRPTKKRALTPVSAQASQLETLFARPDQEIRLPPSSSSTTQRNHLPLPPEIVTNVQGSSAGAGSGEFHVYKAARRREYERLRLMDVEVAEEEAQREFADKKLQREEEDRAKTERNRVKREKMKARKEKAKSGKKGAGQKAESAGNGTAAGGGVKARIVEASKADGDGEADDGKMDVEPKGEEAAPAVADDTPGLLIHDDD